MTFERPRIEPVNKNRWTTIGAFRKCEDSSSARMLALNTGRLQDYVYLFFAAAEDSNKIHIGVVPIVDPREVIGAGRKHKSRKLYPMLKGHFREFAHFVCPGEWRHCRHY